MCLRPPFSQSVTLLSLSFLSYPIYFNSKHHHALYRAAGFLNGMMLRLSTSLRSSSALLDALLARFDNHTLTHLMPLDLVSTPL